MRIGELSERTGVSKRALRYCGEQGLLVPSRTSNGCRVYTAEAPKRRSADDRPAYHGAFRLGFQLRDDAQFPAMRSGQIPRFEMCDELRKRFAERRDQLDEQVRRLTRQRDDISTYLG